jgi:hypothetical protein
VNARVGDVASHRNGVAMPRTDRGSGSTHVVERQKEGKTMSTINLNRAAAALFAVTIATAASAAPADTARINETVTVTPLHTLTAQEQSAISSAAGKILRHVAQARADIHHKDAEAAKASLGKVDTLLNIIEAALPTARVKDRIWVAKKHLEYEDTEDVLPEMVPIYSSLDQLVDLMPVQTAKHHIDKARKHLENNDKANATKELEAADTSLAYNEVDLPLAFTHREVDAAKSALDKGNLDAADDALKATENSVVYISAGVDEPLVAAQSSLWHATRDYAAGAYEKARAEVRQTVEDLEHAATTADAKTSNDIHKLIAKARSLDNKIQTRSADAADELAHLWQHTQALSQRSVEYLSAGWNQLVAGGKLKSNLIEAKYHVANAKIDLFTAKDDADARSELNQAVGYLDNALHQADKTQQVEVRAMRQDAKRLAKDLSSNATDGRERYAQLETRLHSLIQSL